MNLEEMQAAWQEMTEKLDAQKHLTNSLILDMTHEKIRNKISRIARYESIGAVACFIGATFVLLNITKLDTWYLLGCGILVALYFIVLPLIVLRSIGKMRNIDLVNNTYRESLLEFTHRRKRFLSFQRFGIIANFFLMILILPVFGKLINGKDLFVNQSSEWLWFSCIMLLVLIPFSIWGYRKYSRMTASAEYLLRDLDS